jgi:hypothetical protein
MTLRAITAKNNYITILDNQSLGVFQVLGYQRQTKAGNTINDNPLVQVFYENSSFTVNARGQKAPIMNDVTLKIEMTVAADAPVDLATLNDPNSTAAQRAAALANAKEAAANASEILESVWSKVWEITTTTTNYDLGFENELSNLRLDQFQRDEPTENGGFVIVTASAQLTYRIEEYVQGDTGDEPATAIYNTDVNVTADPNGVADPVEETAVEISNP